MKVRFKIPVAGQGFAYSGGQVVELPAEEAKAWIKCGHAEPAGGGPKTATSARAATASRAVKPPAEHG